MPRETADPKSDLGDIKAYLNSAMAAAQMAEKMASAALDRLSVTLAARPPAPAAPSPPLDDRLAVSKAEAGRILSRGRHTVWRWIRDGQLDVTDNGQVTMESIRRFARAKGGGR